MQQPHEILAIVTAQTYADRVTDCSNNSIIINQNTFFADIETIEFNSRHLHLVIDGGHGQITHEGEPLELNNMSVDSVHVLINKLKAKKLIFTTIHLSSCYSAAFIPLFKDLLTKNGVIFCQTLSGTSNLSKYLCANKKDLFTFGFNLLAAKQQHTNEIAQNHLGYTRCFCSDAVYSNYNNTLYRFYVENPSTEFAAHNHLIGANHANSENKAELLKIEQTLHRHNINIDDSTNNADEMELLIREKFFKLITRNIENDDIILIQNLDDQLFSAEDSGLNLSNVCNQKYSWLIEDYAGNILSYAIVSLNHHKNSLYIHSIATIAEARNQGHARLLMRKITEQADKLNLQINLQVKINNNSAKRIYEKHGFRQISASQNSQYIQMQRVPMVLEDNQKKSLITNSETQKFKHQNPKINYQFIFKTFTLSLSICALAIAILVLPSIGINTLMGIGTITGYTVTGISGALSLGMFGSFTYLSSKKDKPSDNFSNNCSRLGLGPTKVE